MSDFEALRTAWLDCARAEDRNSILHQVWTIMWRGAVYRTISAANQSPAADEADEPKQSAVIAEFIQECFFESQAMALRRVIDSKGLGGKLGVWSLRPLLQDMKANLSLLTRTNLTMGWSSMNHESRQRDIDQLTGTDSGHRSDEDVLSVWILDAMILRMDTFLKRIKSWADKFIAHPSTPHSRRQVVADIDTLTVGEMLRAEEETARVFAFVDRYLLTGTQHHFLRRSFNDPLLHASEPLVPPDQIESARIRWREFEDKSRALGRGDWPDWLAQHGPSC